MNPKITDSISNSKKGAKTAYMQQKQFATGDESVWDGVRNGKIGGLTPISRNKRVRFPPIYSTEYLISQQLNSPHVSA
ncbi:MAG: hypothetical protein K1566_13045 [Candidatus Thiodiazotropha sp. (ex. Lucinisca nassula)]|nr:hypothetical protein [Candidatus Thiodiazotropha sp. (ex. Lucinisca nassula)]